VDVGDLPNYVKYCVSVLSLQWATVRTSPVGIPITKCLNNYTAMIQKGELTDINSGKLGLGQPGQHVNKAWVEWKGRQYEYVRSLGLFRIIDFAGN
jgi:hypothetical protein